MRSDLIHEDAIKIKTNFICLVKNIDSFDTGRKCNIYKSFRGLLGRLLNILCVFSLLPVSIENERDSKKITSNKF